MTINDYICEYREKESALLVDLRDAEDFRLAHIPGAVNARVDQIREDIRKLATFNTPVYLYCYGGNRSAQAEAILKAKGYQAVSIGNIGEYTGELEGEGTSMDIRELRREKGLSQAAMAKSIGVKPVTISAIETGRMKVSPKIAGIIREVYGIDVELTVKPDTSESGKVEKQPRKTGAKRGRKAQPRKTEKKRKTPAKVIYQTAEGNEISETDILAKVGEADQIYVRLDEKKAYWFRGEESGSIDLW